jgi:hypothetical protein
MPPTAFNWDPYYNDIVEGRQLGESLQLIINGLEAKYPNIRISKSSLQRKVDEWGILKWSILEDNEVLEFIKSE